MLTLSLNMFIFQLFRRARTKKVDFEEDRTIANLITSSVEAVNNQIDRQEGKTKRKG